MRFTPLVLSEVQAERDRQETLWGVQNHDHYKWLAILMEEVGEAARAAYEGDRSNYREELIQVAAVAVAMVESFDREKGSSNKSQESWEIPVSNLRKEVSELRMMLDSRKIAP